MIHRIALGLTIFFVSASIAVACGTERWAVKTGADRDAGSVNTEPEDTTISSLADLSAPPHPTSRPTSRFSAELKTYHFSGIMTLIKKEKDEDYHIVVADPQDNESTMIVESVSPNCTDGSLFTQEITDVRHMLDQKFGPIKGKKHPNLPVTVTGVGFFDPIHGQEGVAANGIELHPILSVTFE
jgi:hypothetical protein